MKSTRSQSQYRWQSAFHPIQPNVNRGGWTVLEVLISSGIMVVGLACVAALLPAAAQRMAQAVSEDRAGTVAANAYADIIARRSLGLLSASPGGNAWNPTLTQLQVFGTASDELIKHVNGSIHPKNDNAITSSDWQNQDALVFDDNTGSPANTFVSGVRKTKPNPICWLATLVPGAASNNPVRAGDVADLSIAVFKKEPSAIVRGELSSAGELTIQNASVDDDKRRQCAKGCGAVLALGSTPVWIRVNASWTDASGTTHLICDSSYSGDVVLFTNLLRVEKHRVVLD